MGRLSLDEMMDLLTDANGWYNGQAMGSGQANSISGLNLSAFK